MSVKQQQGAFPFLAHPPSFHPPSTPTKPKHRPQPIATYRRRSSTSCSTTASPACLSSPGTPSAAIAAAAPSALFGSHSYHPRRKSQHAPPPSPPHGTSPRSPRRRRASPPSTPFAPPSPLRAHTRAEAPPARLPKVSSLTTMITTVSTTAAPPNSKRARRSATPAKNSQTFQKYRPMPFIQQMQLLQFMEGGTLESHMQRHHAAPGKGPRGQQGAGDEVVHGYAFTDERGMIWFDEEEEWEFACLIPKVDRGEKKGRLRRMLGTKKREEDDEAEDAWERFGSEDEDEGWVIGDANADDDLGSFGGDVATRRPEQSVLKSRPKGKQRRKRASSGSKKPATATATATAATLDTQSVRQEFLSSSFVPSPTRPAAQRAVPAQTPKPSSLALFKRRSASHSHLPTTLHVPASHALYAKSANPSAVTLADVQWAWTEMPAAGRPSGRSVSPPSAAAKRLGIERGLVSLEPPMLKKKKGGLFGRK